MKRVVVDTNVIVSFLTDRSVEQQQQAARLFEGAAAGSLTLQLHQAVLTELVYVLGNIYGIEASQRAGILADLLSLPGVEPVDDSAWGLVLGYWPDEIPDFGDALLAAVAGASAIATFDVRFIQRLRKLGKSVWELD